MPFDGTLENTSHFDFPVELKPLYWAKEGTTGGLLKIDRTTYQPLDFSKHKAVVRTDTGQVLGVHGSRYQLRPFKESVERTSAAIAEAVDCSSVEVRDEVFENGAKMRRSLVFPNLKIEPQINDIVRFRIDAWNSYDGGWADQYVAWADRLWCLNGCTTVDFSVRGVIKHITTEWKADAHIERLKNAITMFFSSEQKMKRWVTREVRFDQIETLFKKTIAHVHDPKRPVEERFSKPALRALLERFEAEPNSLWGAYNSATGWATHVKSRGASHNVERNRHNLVAGMLKSDQWKQLEAA